jgi:hypothetical protein
MTGLLGRAIDGLRALDRRLTRRGDRREVLVDARTGVNFVVVSPVLQAMAADPRVRFSFTASNEPARLGEIYRDANGIRRISPQRAAFERFDAYVASDFMWAKLPRGTARVQIFHGVGGKYGFDAPNRSMREWDRLFFVNRRRLANFIAAGAIDPDSPAIRLIGYPKTDCLVDGSMTRSGVLAGLGLDAARPTVLYAPTWSSASSLNAFGVDLIRALLRLPVNVIVKLHDRSRDPRAFYSGGADWMSILEPMVDAAGGHLATGHDICPLLVAADVMVTDHSSAGFEYLLLDKPLVRIHRPVLLKLANVHPDYVALLASASHSVDDVPQTVAAVERSLALPWARSAERREVAADLFYRPGTATRRAVEALYEVIELDAPSALRSPCSAGGHACQPSA